jgi:Gpi18-like mannosyltransferase
MCAAAALSKLPFHLYGTCHPPAKNDEFDDDSRCGLEMSGPGRNGLLNVYFSHLARNMTLQVIVLAVIDIILIHIFWRYLNDDLTGYLLQWYHFLIDNGRFAAFSADFYDYTPPYLYLLSIGTLADPVFDPPTIIRGISLIFNLAAAIGIFWFARDSGWSREKSTFFALMFFGLPEVVVNGPVWGQSDIIYSLFLITSIYLMIEGRGAFAMAALGVAFSFKLQTVFIGPLVLYLLLVRGLLWRQLLIIPLTYLVLMAPAALAGRRWVDLVTIYFDQISLFKVLSLNAPNPYVFVQAFFLNSFQVGLRIGMVLATAVAVALVAAFIRYERRTSRERLLLMATLALAVMPYVLPEMHERYFFPASAMAFLLVVARPRTWPIVVLIQLADLCAYSRFLLGSSINWLATGAFFMTCAVAGLVWLFQDGIRIGEPATDSRYPLNAQS